MGDVIKFRDSEGDIQRIVDVYRKNLGLGNDSACLRVLVSNGRIPLDDLFNKLWLVAQHLKMSEIDLFVSSIKIFLVSKKREQEDKIKALGG